MKRISNNIRKAILLSLFAGAGGAMLTSCMDEPQPGSNFITNEQLQSSATSQAALLPGIAACMTSCYYNGAYSCSGYPGQMYLREVFGEDFPVYNDAYSYYSYYEDGNAVTYLGYYIMRFYYDLINNCNNVMKGAGNGPLSDATKQNVGIALGFRALAYMDLARYFEYQPTGYAKIDDEAVALGCMKLTVSIVDENTTSEQLKQNPRVPYYTLYRFLMNDLNTAEEYLLKSNNTNIVYPNQKVICGLKARLWLEMASRFELMPEDLAEQIKHEDDDDGYKPLGIGTALDCYAKAAEYAERAMVGYSPMTKGQYLDPVTGFNTAAENSWMWIMRNASTDEFENLYYYYSYLGQMVTEPAWGMAQYGGLFRCISKALYDKMDKNDWRRLAFVSEEAAGQDEVPAPYRVTSPQGGTTENYTTLPYSSGGKTYEWKDIPAYSNLKFRSRSLTDNYDGRVADYPLMRMEEMIFIHAEAIAHTQSVAAGAKEITDFVNQYRQTKATYACSSKSLKEFTDDMMVQKRIEFWGEGIIMWDYKRLRKGINRAYEGSNYLAKYQMRTADGYVVPWMNIRFPKDYEGVANQAAVGSPDPSQVVEAAN